MLCHAMSFATWKMLKMFTSHVKDSHGQSTFQNVRAKWLICAMFCNTVCYCYGLIGASMRSRVRPLVNVEARNFVVKACEDALLPQVLRAWRKWFLPPPPPLELVLSIFSGNPQILLHGTLYLIKHFRFAKFFFVWLHCATKKFHFLYTLWTSFGRQWVCRMRAYGLYN